jgi:hypothetical protein
VNLFLSLSLSHTHTHTHTYTQSLNIAENVLYNNDVFQVTVNIELFIKQFIVLQRNAVCVCHVTSNLLKGNQR